MDLPFEFLNNAFDARKSGVIIYQSVRDENNEIIDFITLFRNKEASCITGKSHEKSIENTLEDIFRNNSPSDIIEIFKKVVITGENTNVSTYFSSVDCCDKYQLYDVEISKFQDGIMTILHKITKPKDGVLETISCLKTHVDNSENMVFSIDRNLNFFKFNEKWLSFRGETLSDELKKSAKDFIHPDDLEVYFSNLKKDKYHNEPSLFEFRLLNASGKYKWVNCIAIPKCPVNITFIGYILYCTDINEKKLQNLASYTPIYDIDSNVTGSIALFHDITEQKTTERRNKELYNIFPILSSRPSDIGDGKKQSTKRPVINRTLSIERLAYDEKLYSKLLQNFRKSFRNVIEDIKSEVRMGNFKQAHYLAHNLKSSSGTIGATELADIAYVIENSLSGKKEIFTDDQIDLLESALCAVMDELSNLSEEQEIKYDEMAALDIEKAVELIEKLKPLLESFDAQSLGFLDEIKSTLYPIGEEFSNLVKQIEICNFEMALETLNNIKNNLMNKVGIKLR